LRFLCGNWRFTFTEVDLSQVKSLIVLTSHHKII